MTTEITTAQIRALSNEAGETGDLAQWAICWVALHGQPEDGDLEMMSPDQRAEMAGHAHITQDAARLECARVVADARAQAE